MSSGGGKGDGKGGEDGDGEVSFPSSYFSDMVG